MTIEKRYRVKSRRTKQRGLKDLRAGDIITLKIIFTPLNQMRFKFYNEEETLIANLNDKKGNLLLRHTALVLEEIE